MRKEIFATVVIATILLANPIRKNPCTMQYNGLDNIEKDEEERLREIE